MSCLLVSLSPCLLTSCYNADKEFPDYEGGTTAYFAYQNPVRTLVLGNDIYDNTLDNEHKCRIWATMGGAYSGRNAVVNIVVDEKLCDNLYFTDEGGNPDEPVRPMPTAYYRLASNTIPYNGDTRGYVEVQFTDDFFKDEKSIANTYVIPLRMTEEFTGIDHILSGTPREGLSPSRTNTEDWEVLAMDYVLYCVKYQNKYSGWWLTHHTTSTADIEHAQTVEIKTLSLNSCAYAVSYQDGDKIYNAELQLTFDGSEKCTITALTDGVTATGSGSWGDDSEKKAWGDKDRDGMTLDYTVTFADGKSFSTSEKLVWQRSGVIPANEFSPVYQK